MGSKPVVIYKCISLVTYSTEKLERLVSEFMKVCKKRSLKKNVRKSQDRNHLIKGVMDKEGERRERSVDEPQYE